jgi:signal transduction histidine kinase
MNDQEASSLPPGISSEEVKKKISALGHDMRTPLATCQSFLNVLEMSEYKMAPDELEMLALDVQDVIEKALSTLQQEMTELREVLRLK